jgi:hypothetical protein
MPAGRPTDYTPELGELILAKMEEGLSLTAAAAELGLVRSTVYLWAEKHPELMDAIKLGQGKRTNFLERRLLRAESGPVVTSSIFALKNSAPDEWREKVTTEHDVTDKAAEALKLDDVALARRVAFLMAKGAAQKED